MCFLRDHSAESAAETLEASVPFRDWIVGVGLDSDERGNPPEKFADVFARARELGYRLTMHCDIDQVGSIDNIRTVLQDIRTDRIDHGTNIVEDPSLVEELRARGHRADLLPDLQPLRHQRHEGHRDRRSCCARGSGSPSTPTTPPTSAATSSTTTWRWPRHAGLTSAEVVTLAENSFAISWIDDDRRAGYLDEVGRYVGGFAG